MPEPDYLLPVAKVRLMVGLSNSAIARRMANNEFPRPLRLSGNVLRWRQSAITAWMDALPTDERQKAG